MPRRLEEWEEDQPLQARRRKGQKKSSVGLWVGLGVGGLVLVGGVLLVVLLLNQSPGGAATSRFGRIPGLVAHWSFDEVQNGTVLDQSGRNNHATLHGGRLAQGVSGQALWLDGQPDQFCDLGNSNDFNFAAKAGFTFAGWFTTSEPSATILSLRSKQGNQQIDLLVRDGRLIIVVGDDQDPGAQNAFVFAQQANDGKWHHFAFSRNGNAVELFLDGASQGTASGLSAGGPITTNLRALGAERLWLLTNDKQWGNPSFRGGIDEVCIFNRALTAAEIQTLMER
jgi:Concanavalin A-like lectin/glucanases superfamily